MSEQTKAEIEALHDLVQSRGWHLFQAAVIEDVDTAFQEHITRALDVPDGVIAMDRARQVAAIRKAALKWLKWPNERMHTLTAEVEKGDHARSPAGRRGTL